MKPLLWTLAALGAWNCVNFVARVSYRDLRGFQVGHALIIALGLWAVAVLVADAECATG